MSAALSRIYRVVWKDGDIVFATSNSPEHSLGQFLLRNGKITLQQK